MAKARVRSCTPDRGKPRLRKIGMGSGKVLAKIRAKKVRR